MCLIIHKPAGRSVPATLVAAAVRFNSDGWGAMGFTSGGRTILTRWKTTQASDIQHFADMHVEVDAPRRLADRSDTWHLVNDHLRPLLERHRELALDRGFLRLFEQSLGPSNRVVLLSQPTRRIDILNAAQGMQYNGLWLSSTRWIDQNILEIPAAPQPQRRSYNATGLSFA